MSRELFQSIQIQSCVCVCGKRGERRRREQRWEPEALGQTRCALNSGGVRWYRLEGAFLVNTDRRKEKALRGSGHHSLIFWHAIFHVGIKTFADWSGSLIDDWGPLISGDAALICRSATGGVRKKNLLFLLFWCIFILFFLSVWSAGGCFPQKKPTTVRHCHPPCTKPFSHCTPVRF